MLGLVYRFTPRADKEITATSFHCKDVAILGRRRKIQVDDDMKLEMRRQTSCLFVLILIEFWSTFPIHKSLPVVF